MTDVLEEFERAVQRETSASQPPIVSDGNPLEAASDYRPPVTPPQPKPYTGKFLPFSRSEEGNLHFDMNAGLAKELVTKPAALTKGLLEGTIPADVRNPAFSDAAIEAGATFLPGSAASRVAPGLVRAPSRAAHDVSAADKFDAFRNSTQLFQGPDYQAFLRATAADLDRSGRYDNVAVQAHEAIQRELRRTQNHPFVEARDVDAFRTQLDPSGLKGKDLAGTMQARENLYGFLQQHGDENIRKAVGDYKTARHSEAVTAPAEATSQKNIAKAQGPELSAEQTRLNIAGLINARKGQGPRGFSDTEMNILRSANKATPEIDRAQNWGEKLRLNTNSLGMLGLTLPTAAAGYALRSQANRGARRMADEADNAIRGQSPLAAEQFPTAPMLNTGRGSPGASPLATPRIGSAGMLERAGQRVAYPVQSNPATAEAVRQRLLTKQPADPEAPMQYRVLPDGTIEEFM
jgi:hypothetical protein